MTGVTVKVTVAAPGITVTVTVTGAVAAPGIRVAGPGRHCCLFLSESEGVTDSDHGLEHVTERGHTAEATHVRGGGHSRGPPGERGGGGRDTPPRPLARTCVRDGIRREGEKERGFT